MESIVRQQNQQSQVQDEVSILLSLIGTLVSS